MTNLGEMLAMTDPPRPDSLVEADLTPADAGQNPFYFQSIPGRRYHILSSGSFSEWSVAATVSATAFQKPTSVGQRA